MRNIPRAKIVPVGGCDAQNWPSTRTKLLRSRPALDQNLEMELVKDSSAPIYAP